MTDYALTADRLRLRPDGAFKYVLDDVSLRIPAGAVVGLVGRNGAGKSTLLRSLVGLTEPDQGSATLLGCPALALTDPVRERLGYAPQSPELFDWMNGYEHLQTIGRAYPRWNEERALALSVQLDIPLGVRAAKMSGGDQQKLSLMLALAHDPDVLLLDEPMSSLDPMTRRDFMRAMFSAPFSADADAGRTRERTIVISSHILSDLERLVSHVAFMREGRLQLFDSWDAMLEHFRVVPTDAQELPLDAIVIRNQRDAQLLVDTRRAPAWRDSGRALSLDELFVELNT